MRKLLREHLWILVLPFFLWAYFYYTKYGVDLTLISFSLLEVEGMFVNGLWNDLRKLGAKRRILAERGR